MMRWHRGVAAAALLSLLVACGGEQTFRGLVLDPPLEAPELAGTNWTGAPFTLGALRGRVAVLFFGYTYCPDVCPLTLAKMKKLRDGLGDAAADLDVVFVSVDPRRDSVEKLAAYVPKFDDSFYGLRLDLAELEAVKRQLGVAIHYGEPRDGPDTDSFYYVDHTGSYFVVDREGLVRVRFSPTATPEEMVPDLRILLAESYSGPPAEVVATRPGIEVQNAWARILPEVGALYARVVNRGGEADRLVAVDTAAAGAAMLHETVEQDDTVKMIARDDGFEIGAGATLELIPGGAHVMLVDLAVGVADAESLAAIFRFERAGAIEVEVPVRDGS